MKATRFVIALSIAALSFTVHTAHANWRKGDPKDIRIKLEHPEFPGRYGIEVSVYDLGGGSIPAQADHLFAGNLSKPDKPFIYARYESASRFQYERLKTGLKRFPPFDKATIDYLSEVAEMPTSFGDVEFARFQVTDDKVGGKRTCGFWQGFFSGNRFTYTGLYCPADREVTDDDMKKAVNAITLKSN